MLSLTVGLFYVFIFSATNCEVIRGDPRIIGGGVVTDRSKFAYQALLYIKSSGIGFCGGAIIHEKFILTATTCVNNVRPEDISVAVGQLDITDHNISRDVGDILLHPEFGPNAKSNNIALVELSEDLDSWTNNVNLINLRDDTTPPTENCVISGWGATFPGQTQPNRQLMAVEISSVECTTGRINYTLCIDDANKTFCEGDAGGPLVCAYQLAGILFEPEPTCTGKSRYTEVSKYVDWINEQIANRTQSPNTTTTESSETTGSETAPSNSTVTGSTDSGDTTVTPPSNSTAPESTGSDNISITPPSNSTTDESGSSDNIPVTPPSNSTASDSTESLTTTGSTSLVTSESDSEGNYTTPKSTSTTTITTTPSSSPSGSAAPPQAADANPDFINSTAFIVIVVLLTVLILVALLILVIVTMLRRTRLY